MPQPAWSDVEARIESVPDDRRTVDRDRAAREILEWMQEPDWPLSGSDMEERGEYSAQHYRHTLSLYELDRSTGNVGRFSIQIPEDADVESYVRGWIAGRKHD